MAWTTPTLFQVRKTTRDKITAMLPGAALVGNSVLRVMADAMAALAHLTLLYIDWLAKQFLPDTAETEWLDRHAQIWLVNADGTLGRKQATLASGSVTVTGISGQVLPKGVEISGGSILYETMEQIVIGTTPTPVKLVAIDAGTAGNQEEGDTLAFVNALEGIDSVVTVVEMFGGSNAETDEELRGRILQRIRNPPMGGCQSDYVTWGLSVRGVTRVWAAQEMGIGTVTVRFMCDDLRFTNDGFPLAADVRLVDDYINVKRPVAVKDYFVMSPIRYPVSVTISNLSTDTEAVRAAIEQRIADVFRERAEPGGTMYAAWVSEAITATNIRFFDLDFEDAIMPSPGHLAILDTINFED